MRTVGRRLPRLDAATLAAGSGRHVAGVALVRVLYATVVRSTVAARDLLGVDPHEALTVPGVVAVLTAGDLPALSVPVRHGQGEHLEPYRQPILAHDRLAYVGEPVALVLAETLGAAEDAAEGVEVHAGPSLPVPADAADVATVRRRFGDLQAAFHRADRIVELDLRLHRTGPVPLDPRASIAAWDEGAAVLTLWTNAHSASATRDALAELLGLPRAAVKVEVFARGGSLVHDALAPEDVLVALAARLTQRPVRWVEDRRDQLRAAPGGQALSAAVRAAVAADGSLLGIDLAATLDQGAYVRPDGTAAADLLLAAFPGPYAVPALRADARLRLSNRPPADPAACPPTFVRERLMDAIGHRLGLDPVAVRRRNLPSAGRHAALIDAATRRFGLDGLRRHCADRRDLGEFVGVGEALFVEPAAEGFEHVVLSVDRGGNVLLVTGAAPDPTGLATELAQIVADAIGVGYDRVRVTFGDTARINFGAGGRGTFATLAAATLAAADALRDRIVAGAHAVLDLSPERVLIEAGRITEGGRQFGPAIELGELAAVMEERASNAELRGLIAEGFASAAGGEAAAPYGFCVAMAEVDLGTGLVRVRRAMIAYEAGNAVNPSLIETRLAVALVAQLTGALHPGPAWSATGEPLGTSFSDVAMPSAGDAPAIEILVLDEAPTPFSPLGIRGAGEGGVTGIAAALAAAVDAALGMPGLVAGLPIVPADALVAAKRRRTVPVA